MNKTSSLISRKVQRKQALFLKHEANSDVIFQEEPSFHVFVANGGLQNGLGRQLIRHLLCESLVHDDHLKELYLPPGKDFAFATFESPETASAAVTYLNGICVQERCRNGAQTLLDLLNPTLLSGPPLHLYLCFVDRIPRSCTRPPDTTDHNGSSALPPGLILIEEFISVDEERDLLEFFSEAPHCGDATRSECASKTSIQDTTATTSQGDEKWSEGGTTFDAPGNVLRHRSVKHYGYEFLYRSSNVDPDCPLPGGLPGICEPLLKRMLERKLVEEEPDQLTVNHYLPGAGIPPHVDTHSPFKGNIISLSLGSHVVMDFRHAGDGRKVAVFLQRRSLLVMAGEARYLWTHGIAARHSDEVHCPMPGYRERPSLMSDQSGQSSKSSQSNQSSESNLSSQSIQSDLLSQCGQSSQSSAITATLMPRGTRTSLTFRKVRRKPCVCDCDYPSLCDSQQV